MASTKSLDQDLEYAVLFDDYYMFIDCIEKGADPCKVKSDEYDNGLLHFVDDVMIVKKLLEYPIDVNKRNINGKTPLYAATVHNRIEIVRVLLDAGADHTIADDHGICPLDIAVGDGFGEIVALIESVDCLVKGVYE